MIAARLPCRRLQPLFSEGQWLRIAARLAFSPRENEIVRLVFQDAPDQAIAAELAISVNTVHTHLKRLYSKWGVTSRAGLVLKSSTNNWPTCNKPSIPRRSCGCTPALEKPPDTRRLASFSPA